MKVFRSYGGRGYGIPEMLFTMVKETHGIEYSHNLEPLVRRNIHNEHGLLISLA